MACKKRNAFTLIELIVVMGVLTMLSVLLIPYTITEVKANNVKSAAGDLSSLIYSYQQEAYSGLNGKSFGFAFDANGYYLFVGTSLVAAETSERVSFPKHISFSLISFSGGSSQIVFSSGSLKPSVFGVLRITDEGSSYDITINSEGFIEYYSV